jgi:hypothetical protein
MKVVLQDLHRFEFVGEDGGWTWDGNAARDFGEVASALDHAAAIGLEEVRVILKGREARSDLELPPVRLVVA